MDAALAAIGLNVQWLMRNVRMLDQLQTVDAGDESQGHIMNAAQDVAAAFLNLMESAMPLKDRQPQDVSFLSNHNIPRFPVLRLLKHIELNPVLSQTRRKTDNIVHDECRKHGSNLSFDAKTGGSQRINYPRNATGNPN